MRILPCLSSCGQQSHLDEYSAPLVLVLLEPAGGGFMLRPQWLLQHISRRQQLHTRKPTMPCLLQTWPTSILECRWEQNSYGYLGEDGKKWHNFEGYEYGSPHQSGDVIGAGIHLERQEIFFTCGPQTALLCRTFDIVLLLVAISWLCSFQARHSLHCYRLHVQLPLVGVGVGSPGVLSTSLTVSAVMQYRRLRMLCCRKNGKHLGVAFRNIASVPLIPAVGLHRRGCCILPFMVARVQCAGLRRAVLNA